MYRKYKENKDNEYEKIIRRQVNESKLVAEQEGISIPKTLEDYVAPSRAAATGNTSKKTVFSLSSQEDDIEIDVSSKTEYFNILIFLFKDDDQMADMGGEDEDDEEYI